MKKLLVFFGLLPLCLIGFVSAQNGSVGPKIPRPKLVVGIVVDQMRWDYLYRYYERYAQDGGFKRLLNQGYACENTFIPYIPTVTACGHACIFTGAVPAVSGITGNDWWDYTRNKVVYCAGDDSVSTVGSNTDLGKMSPANLLVTTICDELRLATNFRSKVIGVAIKDRGSILPAGHTANAAYWYDSKTGDWITSSYYMKELPGWVRDINAKKLVDKYYGQNWNTLYPLTTYVQSTENNKSYENKPLGNGFPYSLDRFIGSNYGIIPLTPYGNAFTFEMAKSAVAGEKLGQGPECDFLTISLSTPDYIGHTFGPNSVEAEDGFLRLDRDLANFLDYLDERIGKGEYLLFLSADHGAAHVPGFLGEHKVSSGHFESQPLSADINKSIKEKFGVEDACIGIMDGQVFLNHAVFEGKRKGDEATIRRWIVDFLMKQPGIQRAIDLDNVGNALISNRMKELIVNGYYPNRSGDIQIFLQPGFIDGFLKAGTSHGTLYNYDSHIPLLWYGWNIKSGKTYREVHMTDIAGTVAALLHIQMPSGSTGQVIEEVVRP